MLMLGSGLVPVPQLQEPVRATAPSTTKPSPVEQSPTPGRAPPCHARPARCNHKHLSEMPLKRKLWRRILVNLPLDGINLQHEIRICLHGSLVEVEVAKSRQIIRRE